MPSKIRILDDHTINKIAAGEVIENPASVVKELVENAIDAGATDVCIEIKGGGRQLIRITDNGCGMNQDDALLCLERHATSKIRDVEDIYAIGTMGFRGEAIPSIASISKFTLLTSDSNDHAGVMVTVEGGKILQCCPIARSRGTTVEVKSLFFNVPVRKKFQRSPAYDAHEILNIASGIALGYPQIKFQLISDQKTILTTKAPNESSFIGRLRERVEDILGLDCLEATCEVEANQDDFRIQGFIGSPSHTRNNRTGQYLFINQRLVASPLISFAIRNGYGEMLSTGRHPVYVLHLTAPTTLVDVNVHPQKREVRLRQEQLLKGLILQSISKALQRCGNSMINNSFDAEAVFFPPILENNAPFIAKPPFESIPCPEPIMRPSPKAAEAIIQQQSHQENIQFFSSIPSPTPPRVLTTLKRYIIVESDGLRLVDQRAAHSRIIYDKLIQHEGKRPSMQTLLIPYGFEATPIESALLLERLDDLDQMGVAIHQTGPSAFIVDAVPHFFGDTDLKEFVSQVLQDLRECQGMHLLMKEQGKRIAAAASLAAVSQNKRLSIEEAQSLINQLMRSQTPYQCPLGKPTMVHLSYEELDKRFLANREE